MYVEQKLLKKYSRKIARKRSEITLESIGRCLILKLSYRTTEKPIIEN